MKNKLAVVQQVPEFVRTNYPAFVEFLQAYYEWFEEEYSQGRLEDLVNIDKTVDDFLKYFRKEIDVHGITANTTDRFYIKNLKELYTAKGSTAGFKFLFKILFNTDSNVIQPWDSVVKASQAEWYQPISILTDITSAQANLLPGNKIIITDASGNTYVTYVTDVDNRRSGIAELFINRIIPRDTLRTFKSYDETISGSILNTVVSVKVLRGGSGFKPGQIFEVSDDSSTESALIKVKSVDNVGGVTAVDVIKFGANFGSSFTSNFAPDQSRTSRNISSFTFNPTTAINYTTGSITTSTADNFSTGDAVTFYTGGTGYRNLPGATGLDGLVSEGFRNNVLYYVIPGATSIKLASSYSNAVNGKYIAVTQGTTGVSPLAAVYAPNYTVLSFTVDKLCTYKGRYKTGYDIVGNLAFLQDSYYYQKFSYVTSLDKAVDQYASLLRRALHPAGTKHFGNLELRNSFDLSLSAETYLNLYTKKDNFRDFVTSFVETLVTVVQKNLSDSAVITEQLVFQISKILSESTTVTDVIALVFEKIFSESTTVADSQYFTVGKSATETLSVNESQYFTIGKTATESIDLSLDTLILSVGKTLTDSSTATDVFSATPSKVFSDSISSPTDVYYLNTQSSFIDNLTIDSNNETSIFTVAARLSESVSLEDPIQFNVTVPTLTDSVAVNESISYFKGVPLYLSDPTFSISDDVTLTPYKYITDETGSITNSGTVYGTPFYTETPYLTQYWENGYLLNELTITN